MAFQRALSAELTNSAAPKDDNALAREIDLQTKIEALITQTRAAEYSSLAPITSYSSIAVNAIVAVLGAVGGWLGKKHGES